MASFAMAPALSNPLQPPATSPAMAAADEDATPATRLSPDAAFAELVLNTVQQRFNIPRELRQHLEDDLRARIAQPKKNELSVAIAAERMQKENQQMLDAFRMAVEAVPKNHLPPTVQNWLTTDQPLDQGLGAVVHELEARLGDSQLSQVYAGTITFFDPRAHRDQILPINWDGLRLRILAAGEGDLTPRGHLNYYCRCTARVVEMLVAKGYNQASLRQIMTETVAAARRNLVAERQAAVTGRLHKAMNEMADALRIIQKLCGDVLRNVQAAAAGENEALETPLTQTMVSFRARHKKLAETLTHVEEAGIQLPGGLRERLRQLIEAARLIGMTQPAEFIRNPGKIQDFLQKIEQVKKRARAISFEFRRIRRKTMALLRRAASQVGRNLEAVQPGRFHDQQRRPLIDAARDLVWCLQDIGHAVEMQEGWSQPQLMRVKAAVLDRKRNQPVIEAMEEVLPVAANSADLVEFRLAGKKLLDISHRILEPVPVKEIDDNEDDPVWASVADLSDAHHRFSTLLEGEELIRLAEMPEVMTHLHRALGAGMPSRVITVQVTPALEREKRCQGGELRLSVAQRLENLGKPLSDLIRVGLDARGDAPELREIRAALGRAMRCLGVTHQREGESGQNYLVELTITPLAHLFEPQDPRLGRSRSTLEKRLRLMPVPGVLPPAVLFGARQNRSLDDLGNQEVAQERKERVLQLVNRSGLIGEVLGLHPLWETLQESDESQLLASEMRPYFAGDAGQGFLTRVVNNNDEYRDMNRVGEEERTQEAALLLEALVSPNGFAGLRETLTAAAAWLAGPALAREIQAQPRAFLLNQREFLTDLGVENPEEQLRAPELYKSPEALTPFHELLAPLSPREWELCLLQLFHRHFLSLPMLVAMIQGHFTSPDEFREQAPTLTRELTSRYLWLSQSRQGQGEREVLRRYLEVLEMAAVADQLDAGLALMPGIRVKIQELNALKRGDLPGAWRFFSRIWRTFSTYPERLEGEIHDDLRHLRELGLPREAAMLHSEMVLGSG